MVFVFPHYSTSVHISATERGIAGSWMISLKKRLLRAQFIWLDEQHSVSIFLSIEEVCNAYLGIDACKMNPTMVTDIPPNWPVRACSSEGAKLCVRTLCQGRDLQTKRSGDMVRHVDMLEVTSLTGSRTHLLLSTLSNSHCVQLSPDHYIIRFVYLLHLFHPLSQEQLEYALMFGYDQQSNFQYSSKYFVRCHMTSSHQLWCWLCCIPLLPQPGC